MVDTSSAADALVAGTRVAARRAGEGPPVVALHHSIAPLDWTAPWDALAADHEVWLVDLPGYGRSERPTWARSVRDLAILLGLWVDAQGIERPTFVGLGLGGWAAAELATLAPARVGGLVLVGAAGIRPPTRSILDQFLISHLDYAHAYFHDRGRYEEVFGAVPSIDLLKQWDDNREMTVRVSWKPYMYSRELEAVLPATGVDAQVVWGEHDAVVPLECGERYGALLDAPLEVIPGCGHAVDLEAPDALEAVVRAFVKKPALAGEA
jgi:pimeloyl-ACP methyl ester carboxylesterase